MTRTRIIVEDARLRVRCLGQRIRVKSVHDIRGHHGDRLNGLSRAWCVGENAVAAAAAAEFNFSPRSSARRRAGIRRGSASASGAAILESLTSTPSWRAVVQGTSPGGSRRARICTWGQNLRNAASAIAATTPILPTALHRDSIAATWLMTADMRLLDGTRPLLPAGFLLRYTIV